MVASTLERGGRGRQGRGEAEVKRDQVKARQDGVGAARSPAREEVPVEEVLDGILRCGGPDAAPQELSLVMNACCSSWRLARMGVAVRGADEDAAVHLAPNEPQGYIGS